MKRDIEWRMDVCVRENKQGKKPFVLVCAAALSITQQTEKRRSYHRITEEEHPLHQLLCACVCVCMRDASGCQWLQLS